MYEISVESHFSAAHHLANYPGNCARWHGHNWTVTVFIQADALGALGMAIDFRTVKDCLHTLLAKFDHTDLNQVPELAGVNPTSEVIARYLYREMASTLDDGRLRVARVQVSETPGTRASYFE